MINSKKPHRYFLEDFADQYRAAKEVQKDAQGAKKNAETKVKQAEPDLKAAKKIQQARFSWAWRLFAQSEQGDFGCHLRVMGWFWTTILIWW